MAAVAGLRGTGDWGTDERPKNFRESILFFQPAGSAPIFALTSKAGMKSVDDPEFSWWAESQNHVRLNNVTVMAVGDTAFTINSVDPTATTMDALWGLATHLKAGDLLLVEPTTDSATFNHEVIEVTAVTSATTFTASRGRAGTTAAGIALNQKLTLIGSAYAEGTGVPTAVSRNPIKFNNLTQIFKNSYELTGTADETRARTGSAWNNDKKRKSFDHARDIENSILWGRKFETTGANGKPLRYMAGIRSLLPASNVKVQLTAWTGAHLLDAIGPVFDFDIGGGDTRIAFAGNQARTEIGKIVQGETGVTMEMGRTITQWGMNFEEMILPMGRVLFKSHPLLSAHPLWERSVFILDFSSIKYVSLKNRDTRTFDDVQTKDEDLRRGYIMTECSLMLDGGGLSCAYLGGITAV